MEFNWLLILMAIIFIYNIYDGWRQGFVRILFSLLGVIASLIISYIVTPALATVFTWPRPIVFAVAFIGTRLVIALAFIVFDIAAHLPIISRVNKLAGVLTGLIKAFFIGWLILAVLALLSGTAVGVSAMQCISQSRFLDALYESDVFMETLKGFGI